MPQFGSIGRSGAPMFDAIDSFRHAIEASLGYAPDDIQPGKFVRFSTNGKRGDAAGWCQLFDDMRGGVFGDFRGGVSETWSETPRDAMTPGERSRLRKQVADAKAARQAAQRDAWRKNMDRIRFLWRQSQPVTEGDPVHRYLCSRLVVDAFTVPECIRIHRAMPYVHEGRAVGEWPAMLAPLIAPNGRTVALHRTYLNPAGCKADVPGPVKKLTPAAGLLAGSSIRLAEPLGGVLGIGEGIETALASALASGLPVVSAYSAGNVASFQWPIGARRLVIFTDADEAGTKASSELSARAKRAGLEVSIMTPTTAGLDWCDVWASRAAVAVECRA